MARAAKQFAFILLFSCCALFAFAAPHSPDSSTNTHLRVRIISGYLMVTSVSINDRGPFDFLIDTGTNTTLIDPQLAAELGLQPKDGSSWPVSPAPQMCLVIICRLSGWGLLQSLTRKL